MAGDRDDGMYEAYYELQQAIHEVIDGVESGDMNFEEAVERLRELTNY